MPKNFHFDGTIKNLRYEPQLITDLTLYNLSDFDVNKADPQGIIKLPNERLGYSKWDLPVQTKSYPFAKIYNIYGVVNRSVLIIPVLKDEGTEGRLEHIQYSTLSLMNLANVYIIFAYFDRAERSNNGARQKLTKQKLNNEIIKLQIGKMIPYHSSAVHWNRSQFGDNFRSIYKMAIRAYEKIAEDAKVEIHPRETKLEYIDKMRWDCRKYEGISIDGLKSTDIEKDRGLHENKYFESTKSVFYLIDGHGGVYYLTAKDVWRTENNIFVVQETRRSNRSFLPPIQQIQDGLFRLIFFGNIDHLYRNGHRVRFQPRLSLYGRGVYGTLYLPCSDREFNAFTRKNKNTITNDEMDILRKLRAEVERNQSLVVEIGEKQ